MLHHDDVMGRRISINHRLDDPNSATVTAFILVKLHSLQSLESHNVEIHMGLKAYIMVTLCLFPGVLLIWTELMCCLKKNYL